MAEGGDFANENFHLDYLIDHDDYEEEVETTRPFQPGGFSTTYSTQSNMKCKS